MRKILSGFFFLLSVCSMTVPVLPSPMATINQTNRPIKIHQKNKENRQVKYTTNNKRSLDTGLSSSNLNVNGIAVGFVPGLSEPIAPNTPAEINNRIGAPMSVMGTYVQLYAKDPNIVEIDGQIGHYRELKGTPVWEIALMPVEGLDQVTPEVAENIGKKMQSLNSQGITVWLRFAHEMNGDWYPWGQKPAEFIEKWKLVTKSVRKWAPKTRFADHDALLGGYTKYWPGDDQVDIIGLSFYHYGGHERVNVLPNPNEAHDIIKDFAQLFGSKNHDRPLVLAETGASYTRSLNGQVAPGDANEHDIKVSWLNQILSRSMAESVPELKAIVWFEVMKNENAAAGNTPVKSEDFRMAERFLHDIVRKPKRASKRTYRSQRFCSMKS